MAFSLDFCDAPISCHAWNKDGTYVALCPNTSELQIYKVDLAKKETNLVITLKEHTQVISSVDWEPETNRIVTCSHDRNAYVWTPEGADLQKWKKDLVILKLDRAATYVRWSPDGKRFAVATGSHKFRVCAWNPDQKWWQSYTFSHVKPTSLNIDFFPDNSHVLVSTTERHARYYTLDESQAKVVGKGKDKKQEFCLSKFPAQGWVNCSAISPSGEWITFSSQDSFIKFVKAADLEAKEADKSGININGLPLLTIAFLSDKAAVGAGFDCQPRLFVLDGGNWIDLGLIDVPDIRAAPAAAAGGGLAAKSAAFGGKQVVKSETIHDNIILGIRVQPKLKIFSTCANDGKLGIWPFDALSKVSKGKALF
jgi:actin related protein 2/3 complex subunit 1A/1B